MTTAHERTSLFLEGVGRNRRQLVTPEGVALPVDIADVGDRLAAFLLDLFFWLLATIVVVMLFGGIAYNGGKLFGHGFGQLAWTIMAFVAFLVRNLYFIHFELAWQGATPGKRIIGLRVVDRRGGPLQPAAVVARNLTREVETFIPLVLLLSFSLLNGWDALALGAWLVLLTALPFFNRDRMRGGDLIAGTMVIVMPRRRLLGDLVETAAQHRFTEVQLDAYGAFELQVLEEVLRRPDGAETQRIHGEICERISRKIGYTTPVPKDAARLFLREFYTAERAFLERRQLFGKPRADKHEGKPPA